MDPLYDVEDDVSHHSANRSSASASSTMSTEQDRRHTLHQQQHPHNAYNHHHRGLRYGAQQLRSQHPDHYTHPTRRPERSREMRRRSSPATSAGSSDLSSHDRLQQHQQQHHPHSPNRAAHEHEDEGYFLSAISGAPSLGVEDLRHTHGGSDTLPAPQTDDGEAASVLDEEEEEDAVVPTWSQGSRLLERRVLQAVDQETMELEVAEEALWVPQVGLSAQALGAVASRTPGNSKWQFGTPPLAPTSAANPSPTPQESNAVAAAGPPRMKEAALLADPRNQLLNLVITNTSASVTLGEIEKTMQWSRRYEPMYGALLEYLQSYQSIFVVSPVDDRVRLRRDFSSRTTQAAREGHASPSASHTQRSSRTRRSGRSGAREAAGSMRSPSAVERRPGKPSLPSAEALAAHIGSVSYSCVGEHLNLDVLETVYRRRGYDTAMMHTVLHVTTQENSFHLFCFSSGAVVWWGMDRKDHWMVEDDFLSATVHIAEGVSYRYVQSEINALFPIWCSFEVDEQCNDLQIASPLGIQPAAVKPSLERLSTVLCFDHYLVPANEPGCSLVMLTFSHSLGRSARVDYFEYVTKWSHRHILSIPAEFSGLLDYFSTKRRIAKLEGEIEVAQLAIQSIHDTPEVLWEVPWLQAYYDMAEQQNTAQSRLSWFTSRSDTLLEQLSHIKARRHRLFMLGSDVFLIVILILDVMFMTSRLVAKMYFKVEEED